MVSQQQKSTLAAQLGEIIPVDPDTCKEMVEYGLGLNSAEIQDHFLNLLGESDQTFEFLASFVKAKDETASKAVRKDTSTYTKPIAAKKEREPKKDPKNAWSVASPQASQPAAPKPKSKTTSQLLKSKPEEKSSKRDRRRNLDNLKDLETLLNSLEVSSSKEKSTVCNCNATRHPLFEVAPNCLNCGKIICAKEGLQPCSFCGHELLNAKERKEISDILAQEKEQLEHKRVASPRPVETTAKSKPKKIVVAMNGGESFWKAQEKAFKKADDDRKLQHEQEDIHKKVQEEEEQLVKEIEYYETISDKDPELVAAQERLTKLLDFQANGAERTKIIDNAADYDTPSSSGTMWLSATERALRLKKQHKMLRKQENQESARTGRGDRVVEMVIKDGKVVMVEKSGAVEKDDDKDDEIEALEQEIHSSKRLEEAAMANNVWDFEADKNKWEKPVYTSHRSEAVSEDAPLHTRVQHISSDPTDLVVSIY